MKKFKNAICSQPANHFLIDIKFDKYPDELESQDFWSKLVSEALLLGQFNILSKAMKNFDPAGMSGIWLLSESHFSFHTWPENKYLSLDIFTCGSKDRTEKTVKFIEDEMKILGAIYFDKQLIHRGFIYE